MKWSRLEWTLAGVYGLAVSVLASIAWQMDHAEWTSELGRAVDRAGLYLGFAGPLLLALTGVAAQQTNRRLDGVRDGLPDRTLPGRAAGLRFAALACVAHAIVLTLYCLTALTSESLLVGTALPVIRQVGWIAACAAAGALLGAYFRTPGITVLAGVLVTVIPNLMGAGRGLTDLILVGSGLYDVAFSRYSDVTLAVSLLMCVSALLVLWPHLVGRRTRLMGGALTVCTTTLAALLVLGNPPLLADVSAKRTCTYEPIQVCGPSSIAQQLPEVATALAPLALAAPGPDAEQRVELWGPGQVRPGSARGREAIVVEWDSTMGQDRERLLRGYAHSAAGAYACDSLSPEGLAVGAALEALLVGNVLPPVDGTYPFSTVAYVRSLPAAQRAEALGAMHRYMFSCGAEGLYAVDLLRD